MSETNWNDFTPVDDKGARKPVKADTGTNWDDFKPAPEPAGLLRKAGDLGLSVAKGVIGVPEAAVGLADIPTGGAVGKFLENEGGAFGFRPKQAKEYLGSLQSDDLQGKQQQFQQADGIIDKTKVALSNPSLITNAVAESVPLMGAGAVPARAVMAVAPKVGALAAGAIGEGVAGAGSAAEQVRQETADGLLTPKQAGLAAASGAATAAFGMAGGKLAQRLGIGDVDTMLAQGAAKTAGVPSAKSIPRQVVEGAISEGWLEELPQSVAEQILQNLALNKPWSEGVEDAAVMGTLAGMAMGGTAAGVSGFKSEPGAEIPPAAPPAAPTEQPPAQPTQGGPLLALPAPDRGVIEVGADGTARTPAYQTPGYVGDAAVTDVVPKMVDPVREAVAAAAEQGGPLSGIALTAIDSGAAQTMQPVVPDAPPAAPISLEEADARDQAAYQQFFDSLDTDPVVSRYFEDDTDIPDFDAASNVSDEEFLRALGATDEEIQDAIATASQPAIPQSRPAVDAGAQANEPAGPRQGAAAAQADQGQVAPRQPSNFSATPAATMGQPGATARPGPGFGLKDALAQIRVKKQEAANAQAAAPATAPAAAPVPAAGTGAVEAAGPASIPATIGANSEPTPPQAIQASPQPAQAGAAPAADAAPGQAGTAAPAGTSTVRALNDGAPTADTGAQAAPAPSAQAQTNEPEFTTLKTIYGDTVTVRTADLKGDKPRLRQYTKDGKSKAVPAIARDNLDITGEARAAAAAENADNPFFNVITAKDGSTFASESAAVRELNRIGMGKTHEVVRAGVVQDGAPGFVIRRKLADAMAPQAVPALAPEQIAIAATAGDGKPRSVQVPAQKAKAEQGINPRVPPENRASQSSAAAEKEPWQMTAMEFSQQEKGNPHWNQSYAGKDDGAYLADTYATHARLVQEAVAAGKLDTPQDSNAPSDFIPAPDGGLDYGEITPEMGKAMRRQAGKIRLRRGDETQGLVHIEARHAKDFASLGFESAQHFVAQVAKGFTKIYKGRGAALDVVLDDQARGMLIVSLEPSVDGDFYDIKTATPIRRDQFKNEEPLWERAGPSASTAVEGSPPYPKGQNGSDSVAQPTATAQPITRADVASAQQQAANLIGAAIDSMPAGEVNRIAKKFLPTMGLTPTASKARNKAAMTDPKVNLQAAAGELGVTLPAEVKRALDADTEGRVADGAQVAPEPAAKAPVATDLTPKQFHEAKLSFIAADTGTPLSEVRENYDTEAGRAEHDREWAAAVEAAAQRGEVLTRQTLDKLFELSPNVRLPESAIPEGYQRPEARKAEAEEKQARVANRKAAKSDAITIADAGEKIGGARKDRWKERGLNLDDLDAMSESEGAELATKANVWKPDYDALAEASEPVTAAMVKVIYDRLAAKPGKNTPEGRRQYVKMMQIVRQVYTEAKGPEAVRTAYLKVRELVGLNTTDPAAKAAARELLFSVYKGRSDPFTLGYSELSKAKKMVADGFPSKAEPWKARLVVGRREGGPGTTERGFEMYQELSAEAGTPLTREQIAAGFFRVKDKQNKTVAFAASIEDAEAAAKTVYERDLKGNKGGKPEPVRPNLDELKRENLPQRIDRDVTSEDFIRDLGFRGVEFGNWSAQDERQRILNMAYDGLMDLAEIMGVPPKAMSLNGTLGMAFGARGGGRFAAHYEPGKLVINMTKIRGGGSMAHEWAHAMDHYFGELGKADAYTTKARGASGWYTEDQYQGVPRKRMERVGNEWVNVEKMRLDNLRPEMAAAFDEVMRALFQKQVTKAEMVRSYELDLERTEALAAKEQDADMKAMYQNMVQNKSQALEELRNDPDDKMYAGRGRSEFANQAQALSGKATDGYWVRPTEMFARAFESWVFDRVTAMGARSDYLVHGVEEDRFAGGGYKGNPYPTGEERARINAAFDKLAGTIQTKETDKGVAMYRAPDSAAPARPLSLDRVNQLVQEALAGIRGAPPVEVAVRPSDIGLQPPPGSVGYGVTLSSGDIYVFQSAMASDMDVFRTVFHELFHRGVRVLVPKAQYVQTMLDLAKGDSRIQQLAIEWKNTEMGQKQRENLRERGYTGAELTAQYEALAIEEALAAVAEEIKAEGKLGSKPKSITIRFLANWLAKLADLAGMKKLAQHIRAMTYNEAERFVMSAIDRSGEPVPRAGVNNMRSEDAKAGDQTQTEAFKDIRYRSADLRNLKASALDQIHQTLTHPGKVSLWDKTVGTMRHLAERAPAFKPVFESAQRFIDDVSTLANEAADAAPRLLPRVETLADLKKKPITAADNKAIARPIFEGTLMWGRDVDGKAMLVDGLTEKYANLPTAKKAQMLLATGRITEGVLKMWQGLPLAQYESLIDSRFDSKVLKAGVVWTDSELNDLFNATPEQVALYREARQAIDRSIDLTARADMLRAMGADYAALRDAIMEAPTLNDAMVLATEALQADARENPDSADRLMAANNQVVKRYEDATGLQEKGYAPLSRFGRYTVDVVDAAGDRQYFGMFESMREANQMAVKMRSVFPGAAVTSGTMSQEAYKLFAGITPETLEQFGNMLGLQSEGNEAQDKAFQEYIKLAKNNHSALKRLIYRQGIAGYSEDVGRVLASFVYSNARQAAGGLNAGTMEKAINAIPKEQGELKDVAMGLQDYIANPQEEGQAVRGMLFAQYLGGSVASAFVNMTQPFAVTMPYLSQFGGMRKASAQLARAVKDVGTKEFKGEPDLQNALHHAVEDGTVAPQEIHQLMAQARGTGSLRVGDGTRLGDARAAVANNWERVKVAWGQPFALAEQFNRRSTFIAAYRIAKEQGQANPADFARKAVLETQFLYSKANKARWARGAVGGTLMTFKTYSVSYLELLQRTWNAGEPGSPERAAGRRAVAWAVVMLMLMGGAGGLPFAEDAEDLIDGIGQLMGYNVSAKQWRKELLRDTLGKELGDFVNNGVSGLPGAPIDVSGRLGMGNLIPGTGLLLTKQNRERDVMELAGPAGDLVARGFTGGRKLLTGDVGGAALELSPSAVRNAAKGIDMAASGIYKDAKGYKVLDTTLTEAAAKFIGFQPRNVAEVQEANAFMLRSKSFYTQTSSEIKAQWAKALFEKDDGALQEVRERLEAWNRNNPDQKIVVKMPDVWKRVREMGKDRTQRIADTAPKALRQQMREEAANVKAGIV